jgi:hypothetical protein
MNTPLRMKIAKEFVALSGTIEIVLGTFIGYRFGVGDTKAWLYTLLLGVLTYVSTRIWIWYFDFRTKHS